MATYIDISADPCGEVCVEKYMACTRRKYTGCVEVMRVCREECPEARYASPAQIHYIRALGA